MTTSVEPGRPRVLILEDSLTVRMNLHEAFSASGFETTLCATAEAARAALESAHPDLIILDVMLPDADGIEVLKAWKEAPATAGIPVVLLSSASAVRDRIRGLRTGADDYVGKPYDPVYLVERARQLVRVPPDPATRKAPLVLLIDDSLTFREALKGLLLDRGYEVITAADGEEGLRQAAAWRPDATVCDGEMPGIDGTTVIQRLRMMAALRRMPCILLTGSDAAKGELDALEAGADAYVHKSADGRLVLARLEALLRTAVPADEEAAGAPGPRRVLLLSGRSDFLAERAGELSANGCALTRATTLDEAHALLAVEPTDAVLLDVDSLGLAPCRALKADLTLRDMPLLALSERAEPAQLLDCLDAGADDGLSARAEQGLFMGRLQAQLRRKQFLDEHRRLREDHLQRRLMEAEARAATELAESRARMLAEVEQQVAQRTAELQRANERLLAADHHKNEFLAVVSHELRTPLTAIKGFGAALQMGLAGPVAAEQRACVDEIVRGADRMMAIVTDMLDFAKIAAGKLQIAPGWHDVGAVVEEAVAAVAPLAAEKELSLELAVQAQTVWIDRARLTQVLLNLLGNAIKFTPSGGRIRLEAGPREGRWVVTIADTGVGFSREEAEHLFTAFWQADMSATRDVGGTGLGLGIVKALVEAHGGTIEADSAGPGLGATFVLGLPLAPASDVSIT